MKEPFRTLLITVCTIGMGLVTGELLSLAGYHLHACVVGAVVVAAAYQLMISDALRRK